MGKGLTSSLFSSPPFLQMRGCLLFFVTLALNCSHARGGGLYLGPTHPRASWAGRRWLPWSLCLSEASTPAAGRAGAGRAQRGAVETRPPRIQPKTLDFADSLRMRTWSPFQGALRFGGMAPLTARFKKERPIKFTNA